MKKKRIAVLMGGISAEREVSLVSGQACCHSLKRSGYEVIAIDAGLKLMDQLEEVSPDIIFNALHGRWGEDGIVQGLLETYGKPYTHSGVLSSALAMDKPRAKTMFESVGIPCPSGVTLFRHEITDQHILEPPYIVKPAREGSSVGIILVESEKTCLQKIYKTEDWPYDELILVERYIKGKELTVTVMEGKALNVTEIKPKSGFYDFKEKYSNAGAKHILPAEIPVEVYNQAMEYSEKAYTVLGCSGVARADLRFDPETNELYVLEINTQPGMTPTSLVPEQAEYQGIEFDELVCWIVEMATLHSVISRAEL